MESSKPELLSGKQIISEVVIMKILVIAAHPDDEVLGCGGVIARYSREKHEVYTLILGEGATSRYDKRNDADPSLVKALEDKSRKAAEILGAKKVYFSGFPDNRFDTVPLLDIVKAIETLINEIKPEIVYTQHGGDLNIDHVITFRAALTATRPMAGVCVKEVYAYEVPSSSEWAFQAFDPQFKPNVFVDISKTLDLKIEAMKAYESESREFPHPRSPEALRSIAMKWGSTSGMKAAEAFQLIRKCII